MKIIVPSTLSAHIFQKGPSFIVKKIDLPKEHKSVIIDKPSFTPNNSFWISDLDAPPSGMNPNLQIQSVEIVEHDEKKETTCTNFREILEHNVGKKVRIFKNFHLKDKIEEKTFTGKIKEVASKFCLLETEKGSDLLTEMSNIVAIIGVDKNNPISLKYSKKHAVKKIKINYLSKGKKDPQVSLTSLHSSLSCQASYRLFLNKEKGNCNIKMEITFLNNLEDIDAEEFHFHFGPKPSFRPEFRLQLSNNLFQFNKSMLYDNAYNDPFEYSQRPSQPQMKMKMKKQIFSKISKVSKPSSFSNDDLFGKFISTQTKGLEEKKKLDSCFYTIVGINSKKNSRVMIPMFNFTVNFQTLYTCDLEVNSDSSLTTRKIIRVPNKTTKDWTGGNVMVTSNKSFYEGSTSIPFVPKGGEAEIELKKTEKIKVYYSERSIEIKGIKHDNKHGYIGTMIMEGKILIKNFKKKNFLLNLKYEFNGKYMKSSIKPRKEEKVVDDDINPLRVKLNWEIKMEKKKPQEIIFTYSKWAKEEVYRREARTIEKRRKILSQQRLSRPPSFQSNARLNVRNRITNKLLPKPVPQQRQMQMPVQQMQMPIQVQSNVLKPPPSLNDIFNESMSNAEDFFEEQQMMNDDMD